MDCFDVIIIGAGPAGLFSAVKCASRGLSVCIFESNKSAGKKLLVTGQGKCNITNSLRPEEFITHYGTKLRFVRKCIYSFSNNDLIIFFSSCGLKLVNRGDGKIFPESESSADVLNHLLSLCRKYDVQFLFNSPVSSAEHDGNRYIITSGCNSASSEYLIIATGGFTFPSTGSNGSGYKLAENLGHYIVPPKPALAGIETEPAFSEKIRRCSGISIDCGCTLIRNGKHLHSYSGILLFTHRGVSGPVIIDNSRDFQSNDILKINLLPGLSYENLNASLIEYGHSNGKNSLKTFFTKRGLPERLVKTVFTVSGESSKIDHKSAETASLLRKKLAAVFTGMEIPVRRVEGRNRAMCTAGGVDTTEINPLTMESRIKAGLYFAGEVIDVDGDSGGFNLQFAFSSANSAATAILKKHKINIDA